MNIGNRNHIGLWFHPTHCPTSTVITMVALKNEAQYYPLTAYTFHRPNTSGCIIIINDSF